MHVLLEFLSYVCRPQRIVIAVIMTSRMRMHEIMHGDKITVIKGCGVLSSLT